MVIEVVVVLDSFIQVDGMAFRSRVDPSHGSAAWTTRLADEGGTTLAWAEEEEEAEASIVIA